MAQWIKMNFREKEPQKRDGGLLLVSSLVCHVDFDWQ